MLTLQIMISYDSFVCKPRNSLQMLKITYCRQFIHIFNWVCCFCKSSCWFILNLYFYSNLHLVKMVDFTANPKVNLMPEEFSCNANHKTPRDFPTAFFTKGSTIKRTHHQQIELPPCAKWKLFPSFGHHNLPFFPFPTCQFSRGLSNFFFIFMIRSFRSLSLHLIHLIGPLTKKSNLEKRRGKKIKLLTQRSDFSI